MKTMLRFPSARFLTAGLLLTGVALTAHAGKPDRVEDGKHGKSHAKEKRHDDDHRRADRREDRRDDRRDDRREGVVLRQPTSPGVSVNIQIGGYFREPQRQAAYAYYEPRLRSGKCPPGLAKKHNGCMPPGQVKHWHRGQPLPREVVYYPVPAEVQVNLGVAPAGHKFVRVASDILLIAVGTGLVVDAIEDLGRL